MAPVAARKIKSPIPGGPPGNAENSLCRVHLPTDAKILYRHSRRLNLLAIPDIPVSYRNAFEVSPGLGWAYFRWIIPRRIAIATACVRSLAANFSMMCLTCTFTVSSVMKSFSPMSRLRLPSAI